MRDGDPIVLDVDARRLDLDVPAADIARRLDSRPRPSRAIAGATDACSSSTCSKPNEGCDFDFLRHLEGDEERREPYGLLSGWIGGW